MTHPDGLLLAVDQGTTTTKALVFDSDGGIVSTAVRRTPTSFVAPGRAECDAAGLWQAAAACIRDALAGVPAGSVRCVGVCGFMHSLIAVDGSGDPLHPLLLWPDQRCADQVNELGEYAETITRITGKGLNTLSSLPRLRWLGHHAPIVLADARCFLLPKDFVRFGLTGQLATDLRDAEGTGLVDAASRTWSVELLDLVGVPADRMPPIRPPDEIVGVVTAAAGTETGLVPGTPVITGTGDWPATLIGSGCCLPERTCLYLGSAGILGAYASPDDLDHLGRTCYFGSVTSTGTALRWIRDLLYQQAEPPYERLLDQARQSEPGARGLTFLPHLMGERGGRMRPHARGTLHGLTLAHQPADIIRSVLEGTTIWLHIVNHQYASRQRMGDLMVFGGGAQHHLWRQISAAVFNRPLHLPRITEAAALGTAMLAAVGTGIATSYRDLANLWTSVRHTQTPDPRLVDTYQQISTRYQHLETTLAHFETDDPTVSTAL